MVCAEPLFELVGVEDIKWFNRDHWLRGRRQGPILFDDTDPLFLLPAGPPLSSPRNSRAARTVTEAKGALGNLTPPPTSHSIISVDPGERFLVAAHVSQPGSRESRFITLGKEGPAEERRRAADIRRELGTRGLQAQVLADFTGSSTQFAPLRTRLSLVCCRADKVLLLKQARTRVLSARSSPESLSIAILLRQLSPHLPLSIAALFQRLSPHLLFLSFRLLKFFPYINPHS